jgi:hypothetical protein
VETFVLATCPICKKKMERMRKACARFDLFVPQEMRLQQWKSKDHLFCACKREITKRLASEAGILLPRHVLTDSE